MLIHIVGLSEIYNCQYRKNKGLQRNDEDVEYGPHPLQHAAEDKVDGTRAEQ